MITAVTLSISLIGIFLLMLMLLHIGKLNSAQNLNRHRSKDAAFSDKLIYASIIDDGVILCKNGALMASWLYTCADNNSSTDAEMESVSYRINQALSKLGSGWMLHIDCARSACAKYSDPDSSFFPDPITAAIEEERRRLFEKLDTFYTSYFVITITYLPPRLIEQKFIELLFDEDLPEKTRKINGLKILEDFNSECRNIESRLSSAINLVRLKSVTEIDEDNKKITYDEMLRWLNRCISGDEHPVVLPSVPMYIDALLAEDFWPGVVPKIGSKFVQVVAIDGFPSDSVPSILSNLTEIPCDYRWSTRFIFLDSYEAENLFIRYRKKWKQKIRGFIAQFMNSSSSHVDEHAAKMTNDAQGAIAEINSRLVGYGFYTSVIVLMSENRDTLLDSARIVEKAINQRGFAARLEDVNTVEAYLGSLPGHGVENVRMPPLNTMNLADLIPTSTVWTGKNYAPSPRYPAGSPPLIHAITNGATPFWLNLHVRELGHTAIFGPTRAGKSTHVCTIAAQFRRYQNSSIFVMEMGMSMFALVEGAGELHLDVGGDESPSCAPLQHLDTREDIAWALEWIETILILNNYHITPEQRVECSDALKSLSNRKSSRTLSDFKNAIQNEQIRIALSPYTLDGPFGHLFDADDDNIQISNFTVFEIEKLMSLGDKFAIPMLLYLFRRIEKSLHGQPALFIFDEAWVGLSHPVFKERLKKWLKTFAKLNCAVVLSTQQLSDAFKSDIFDVIVESTASKIFLPNPHAHDETACIIYKRMGLNDKHIDIIARAAPQRQYYYVSQEGKRLYELALGKLALSFVGISDPVLINEIKELKSRHGKEWPYKWLEKRNIDLNNYLTSWKTT